MRMFARPATVPSCRHTYTSSPNTVTRAARPDPHPFPRHKAIHVSAGLPLPAACHGDGARYLGEELQLLAWRILFGFRSGTLPSRLPAASANAGHVRKTHKENFSVEKRINRRPLWAYSHPTAARRAAMELVTRAAQPSLRQQFTRCSMQPQTRQGRPSPSFSLLLSSSKQGARDQ